MKSSSRVFPAFPFSTLATLLALQERLFVARCFVGELKSINNSVDLFMAFSIQSDLFPSTDHVSEETCGRWSFLKLS